eukprot:TRINITY_DN2555_c0_g1_i6.p1 TRINITY_DN2555_c0_g1~~TRINITY_DN2555_c0_g1_i6.p1  ORF type:complete len:970 (-),score=278.59 TRINITY_DN2555_c0_g1_i6:145-2916(-)
MNSFKECIAAFSKNVEVKSSTCEELQELFFKQARSNKSLPEDVDVRMVDAFITVLVRVIAVNYGCPVALEGLGVLLAYLKNDDRVFARFRPSKELMLQLNFDRYLYEDNKEAKRLVLDFICFLLRYYNGIEYSDLSSDPEVYPKIHKAEIERIWADIENLAINQETMLKVSEQNKEVTSNAFSELFSHIESIKKINEFSVLELKNELQEIKQQINKSPPQDLPSASAELSMKAKLESSFAEGMTQMQRHADIIMGKVIGLESRHETTAKKANEASDMVEDIQKKAQRVVSLLDFETQLIKDVKSVVLSRLSKVENDIFSLMTKAIKSDTTEPKKHETVEMTKLRIELLQNQVDTEVLPKLSQMLLRIGTLEISSSVAKTQANPTLLEKLEQRGAHAISELIKSGVEATLVDLNACKRGLEAMKAQFDKLQEDHKSLKTELKKSMNEKYKAIEDQVKVQSDRTTEKSRAINEKIKLTTIGIESLKKEMSDLIKIELKGLTFNSAKSEQKISQLESEEKKLASKLNHLEEKTFPLSERVASLNGIMSDMRDEARNLIERIQFLESRSPIEEFEKELQILREDIITREEKIKVQVEGNSNSCWNYVQQFADLHAVDKANEIRTLGNNYTAKLNCLEWLIRYHEYLSEKSSFKVIEAFKDIIHPTRIHERTAYSTAKHSSDIMNQIVSCIRKIKKINTQEELKHSLSDAGTYMAILEITLINDQNVDKAIALGIPRDLIHYLIFFKSSYDFKKCAEEFKLTLRCLTYCFRNSKAIDLLLEVPNGVTTVANLMQTIRDEEIIANSAKIIRVCLRGDRQYDKVIMKVPNLLSAMLQLISTQSESTIILDEVTGVLRHYTRKSYALGTIEDPTILGPLCKLVMNKGSLKYKEYAIVALRNCCKSPRLLSYIKQTPAYEVIIQATEETPNT